MSVGYDPASSLRHNGVNRHYVEFFPLKCVRRRAEAPWGARSHAELDAPLDVAPLPAMYRLPRQGLRGDIKNSLTLCNVDRDGFAPGRLSRIHCSRVRVSALVAEIQSLSVTITRTAPELTCRCRSFPLVAVVINQQPGQGDHHPDGDILSIIVHYHHLLVFLCRFDRRFRTGGENSAGEVQFALFRLWNPVKQAIFTRWWIRHLLCRPTRKLYQQPPLLRLYAGRNAKKQPGAGCDLCQRSEMCRIEPDLVPRRRYFDTRNRFG